MNLNSGGKSILEIILVIRRHSIYSMDDESRQGFFCLVGGNKNKNKICLPADVEGETNKKNKN